MDDMSPEMGMNMMQQMMKEMTGEKGGNPMQMCISMCQEMTDSVKKMAELAAFATPELHLLFSEWLESQEQRVIDTLSSTEESDLESISEKLKLTHESTAYLLARLAGRSEITLQAKLEENIRSADDGDQTDDIL